MNNVLQRWTTLYNVEKWHRQRWTTLYNVDKWHRQRCTSCTRLYKLQRWTMMNNVVNIDNVDNVDNALCQKREWSPTCPTSNGSLVRYYIQFFITRDEHYKQPALSGSAKNGTKTMMWTVTLMHLYPGHTTSTVSQSQWLFNEQKVAAWSKFVPHSTRHLMRYDQSSVYCV